MNHFYANSSPSRWCAILLFQYLIEHLSRHFFRLFTTRFDVFRAYSIAVARLTFFSRLSVAACTSFLKTPESHLSCPRSLVFKIFCSLISSVIILSIVISLFVVQLAVELSEDVGNSFPRCHHFSFFILRFEDECLFPCGFDQRYVLDSTELLKDLLYRLFPFCSCFVPDALLDPRAHLLSVVACLLSRWSFFL